MPQKSGFFDSTSDDPRLYPAREFAEYFARFIGNGIYSGGTQLKVSATGTDNKVSIATGFAWINGYLYSIFSEPLSLTLTPATTLDRIDRIVLRLNVSTPVRAIRATILQGTPGTSPVAPALTRSGDIYDISLAQVRLTAGSAIVLPHQVTDERLNNTVCGVVTGLIQQADTTQLFNEFQSWLTLKKAEYQQAIDNVPIVGITSRNVHLEDLAGNFVAEDLEGAMQELFTNVSDGKALVAGAITGKGVPSNPSDTFPQMANKIGQLIISNGNAQATDVLTGRTFSNASGAGKVGTMPNRAGDTAAIASSVTGTTLKLRASEGYRDGVDDNVTITDANFLAENIPLGMSVFGKTGSKVIPPEHVLINADGGIGYQLAYTIVAKIRVDFTGVLRFRYLLQSGGAATAYGIMYKNGTPFGVERTATTTGGIEVVQDLAVNNGDIIDFRYKTSSGSSWGSVTKINVANPLTNPTGGAILPV